MGLLKYNRQLVFGLDIGTRSIVGTVGYQDKNHFIVVAQSIKEHETRAMLDGQIHDIQKVGESIKAVKQQLEVQIDMPLSDVCIAAAGRVLRTVTTHVDSVFSEDKTVKEEDIYALSAMGVEKAYENFYSENETSIKFYCVGYSVVRYYMNDYIISNPQNHKAASIGADMIVTFLPNDVVDGLYKAVEYAGLKVANLTLEPIAAIQVAIPEKFRMLNIALVDVGAGTSDVSITNDGAIVAYGMIPIAGDCLTEKIAKYCLVDFNTAEQIKKQIESSANKKENITYVDIMGLNQKIASGELETLLEPLIEEMTEKVAKCITDLNGGESVSAVFVVGGGGKIKGYTELLAQKLNIMKERVAIRGEDVMGFVEFPENAEVDSTLVTPIGICLSFYEQNNNFIFVTFNEERLKIYDNGRLSVVDAAMQSNFPNEGLFPKRGDEISFTVDGKTHIKRGSFGEAAFITVNGENADIHTAIKANDIICVTSSTKGDPASQTIGTLKEYQQTIQIKMNGQSVSLPKFAKVNGTMQSEFYEIRNGDKVEILNYYSLAQVLTFMDLDLPLDTVFTINQSNANLESFVYEGFDIQFNQNENPSAQGEQEDSEESKDFDEQEEQEEQSDFKGDNGEKEQIAENEVAKVHDISIVVNGKPIIMHGKTNYVYVDVFDYINFDLSKPQGSGIVTNLNGKPAEYLEEIKMGDVIDIFWKDREDK